MASDLSANVYGSAMKGTPLLKGTFPTVYPRKISPKLSKVAGQVWSMISRYTKKEEEEKKKNCCEGEEYIIMKNNNNNNKVKYC